MELPLRILFTLLFLAVLTPCYATDIVRIDAKYKKDTLAAPDPEFPIKAQHLGYQGQGIYRLVVNEKTGIVDEVKVMKTTGHRELDASAVMTLFQWKFRPGVNHRDFSWSYFISLAGVETCISSREQRTEDRGRKIDLSELDTGPLIFATPWKIRLSRRQRRAIRIDFVI